MKYKYRDVKGLETERRDYCDFSHKVFDNILDTLMNEKSIVKTLGSLDTDMRRMTIVFPWQSSSYPSDSRQTTRMSRFSLTYKVILEESTQSWFRVCDWRACQLRDTKRGPQPVAQLAKIMTLL